MVVYAKGKERSELRKDMQLIFQDPFSSLDPRKSVFNLIAEPLRIYHEYADKNDLQSQIASLMEAVGLAPRLETAYAHELDGGRRQRVGIARALALSLKFIVCDEPVSALDVSILIMNQRSKAVNSLENQTLQEVTMGIVEIIGSGLDAMILYGSYAIGTQKDDSDVDIALILNGKMKKTRYVAFRIFSQTWI